jgi:WD40 repeat protein
VFASLTAKGEIELWDVEQKKRLHLMKAPHPPKSVTFSPDGGRLAVGEAAGQNDVVSLWDVKTGELLRRLIVLQNLSVKAAFSPEGDTLATWGNVTPEPKDKKASPSKVIQLWETATGKERRRITIDGDRVETVAFSPDEKVLAVLTWKTGLHVLDTKSGKVVQHLKPHFFSGRSLHFSPDGKYLVAMEQYGRVQLWETATWKSLLETGGRDWWISSVVFPGKQILACGIAGQSLKVRDLLQWQKDPPDTEHRFIVQALHFLSNRSLLSADRNGQVFLWELEPGRPLTGWSLLADLPGSSNRGGQFQRLAISPRGSHLVASLESVRQAHAWDLHAKRRAWSLPGADDQEMGMALSSDNKLALLLLAKDKKGPDRVAMRSLNEQAAPRSYKLPAAPLNRNRFASGQVVFSPDGQLLAAAVQHNERGVVGTEVFLWDLKTGYEKSHLLQNLSYTPVLAFSPDGSLLAMGGPREGIGLVDIWTGKLYRFEGVERSLDAVAFSPDGCTIAGAAYTHSEESTTVYLWERVTGKIRHAYRGHWGRVFALAFSPNGKVLASAGADSTILLWDVSGAWPFLKAAPPTAADGKKLWDKLALGEAREAFAAMGQLVAHPTAALPQLKRQLQPNLQRGNTPEEVRKLIADLDDDTFKVREQATMVLKQLGERVVPELHSAMKTKLSLEMRRRIEMILDDIRGLDNRPHERRHLRAVEVLERIGSPEAQQLLQELAEGSLGTVLTEAALAAVTRLKQKR